jgi:hypothetical protein
MTTYIVQLLRICALSGLWLNMSIGEEFLRIAVPHEGTNVSWKPFEKFVNDGIRDRNGNFRIEFVTVGIDELSPELVKGNVHGALLPPLRYVLLDLEKPIVPIARLVRAKMISGASNQLPTWEQTREGIQSYTSIVVMRRNSGAWPPDRNTTNLVLGALSPTSTSGFLYPAFWLHEHTTRMKERKDLDPTFRLYVTDPLNPDPDLSSLDIAAVVQNPKRFRSNPRSADDTQTVVEKLITNTSPGFSFIGIGSDRFDKLLIPEKKAELYELGRSPPIYFDVFALDASITKRNPLVIPVLQETLLSTRNLTYTQRTNIFIPIYRENQQSWASAPDIHSFEGVSEADYDDIRRKWVLLAGGSIIRLGMAASVHQNSQAGLEYFRRVRRLLMKPSNSLPPVYLQIEFHPEETLQDLRRKFENGDMDVVEANASEAGQLLANRTAHAVAIAEFRDKIFVQKGPVSSTVTSNTLEHRFVILSAGPSAVDASGKIAYADSSSGYRFPIYRLEGRQPGRKINSNRLVEVNDYLGVYKALRDYDSVLPKTNAAPFGIIAEYEWFKLSEDLGIPVNMTRLPMMDADKIPNTILIARRDFAPVDSGVETFTQRLTYTLESVLTGRRPPQPVASRIAALKALEAALLQAGPAIDLNSPTELGFIRYQRVSREIVTDVVAVHRRFADKLLHLTLFALIPLAIGIPFIIFMRFQTRKPTASSA